jgi:hypothetical protein
MKTNSFTQRFQKGLVITLLYAFVLNILMPTVYAVQELKSRVSWTFADGTEYSSLRVLAAESTTKVTENKKQTRTAVSKNNTRLNKKLMQLKSVARSQSSGPGNSDNGGYNLNSVNGMVDNFTGDFSYSIPIADVEGYPITLNYNSSVNMFTDASWVGLGWNLNVGSVNREMRGIPDEFNGEQVVKKYYNQQPDETTDGHKDGGYLTAGYKNKDYYLAPSIQLTALWGSYKNTYLGKASTFDFGIQSSFSFSPNDNMQVGPTFGIGYSKDSKRGIGRSLSYGISGGYSNGTDQKVSGNLGLTFGSSFHSRNGLTDRSFGYSLGGGHTADALHRTKSNYNGGDISTSSSFPCGSITSIPYVRLNSSGKSNVKSGNLFVGYGIDKLFSISLGYMHQQLSSGTSTYTKDDASIDQPAIGYFHTSKRVNYTSSSDLTRLPIMDFNRTNDQEFSENMKNLAFSFQTFDLFTAHASGLATNFRGNRSDYSTYYDPTTTATNVGNTAGAKVGVMFTSTPATPAIAATPTTPAIPAVPGLPLYFTLHVGASGGQQKSKITSGVIDSEYSTSTTPNFLTPDAPNNAIPNEFDGAVYFKSVGEKTPQNMSDYTTLLGNSPIQLNLEFISTPKVISQTTTLLDKDKNPHPGITSTGLNYSEPKTIATFYKMKTAAQMSGMYSSYGLLGPTSNLPFTIDPLPHLSTSGVKNDPRAANHLGGVEVVTTDGIKYKYDIASYEINSAQVTFAAGPIGSGSPLTENSNGLATYTAGIDNTVDNPRGDSHYFDKTVVPAYPSSFLLTQMESSDYLDRTNNGPTLDDVGNYYKFNYTRLYGQTNPYKWRFPVTASSAMLNKGLLGTALDDMANYSYGEKEVWYSHSVESKNLIAEFILQDRADAYGVGVNGENGGIDSAQPLKRLYQIRIYNRSERTGANGANAVPLQTVEFIYDYTLCPNNPSTSVPNGPNGKLTLKQIRSFNNNSPELSLYAYTFAYDAENNQPFHYKNVDNWGNYKAQSLDPLLYKPSDLFPYAEQNMATADLNSKAWKLTKITNPASGTIEVGYESDSYSTVQDKRVMKHMDVYNMINVFEFLKIKAEDTWTPALVNPNRTFNSSLEPNVGFSGSTTEFQNNYLAPIPIRAYTHKYGKLELGRIPNNVILFKLKTPIPASDLNASETVRRAYFLENEGQTDSQVKAVYFKMQVNVKGSIKEYIPTFATISDNFVNRFEDKLPVPDDIASIGVMPVTNGMYEYGYVITEPARVGDNDKEKHGFQINSLQKNALEFCRANLPDVLYGTCSTCVGSTVIDESVKRYGDDINEVMDNLGYAQSFDQTLTSVRLFIPDNKKYGGNGCVKTLTYTDNWLNISDEYLSTYTWSYPRRELNTGNAAFEPRSGLDECSLYGWETYSNFVDKFPDESRFTPLPIAEAMYPGASIGYAKVKVQFDNSVNAGYAIHEFYTSKDYPVIFSKTDILKIETKKPKNLFTGRTSKQFGLSQGFAVRTNDFHGKPKSSEVNKLDPSGAVIKHSGSKYTYANLGAYSAVMDRDGTVTQEKLATEFDIHADSRQVESNFKTFSIGVDVRLKVVPPAPIPGIGGTFFRARHVSNFYTHTFVKHLNESAIVTKIESENLGSINHAEDLVYDKYTGNTIVSSLTDEFNDKLYSVSYPAHWYYRELRELNGAVKIVVCDVSALGTLSGSSLLENLTPGDLVLVQSDPMPAYYNIAKNNATGALFLMSMSGFPVTTLAGAGRTIIITKSNRDNRLNEAMQSVVTKKNPTFLDGSNNLAINFPTTSIISSSALGLKDKNSMRCGVEIIRTNLQVLPGTVFDPYTFGARGTLVLDAQYAWQGELKQTNHAYKTRFDGTYLDYAPYYAKIAGGDWVPLTSTSHPGYGTATGRWRNLGTVNQYDEFGKGIESKDQLGVQSSVLYGFSPILKLAPTAQAVNAQQQEIAFDGFEDYSYYSNVPLVTLPATIETHFDFASNLTNGVLIDNVKRHSGVSSLSIPALGAPEVTKFVAKLCNSSVSNEGTTNEVKLDTCNCVKPFEPIAGKEYIVGAWVQNTNPANVSPVQVKITFSTGASSTFSAAGPVLDGWQRIEGKFTVPLAATTIKVRLENTSTSGTMNIDDLRIHPVLAGMTTTVYDPKTMLPIASHDGYNFTTFYNYDENLNLVRVRVETIEGIKTVTESEMGGYRVVPQ